MSFPAGLIFDFDGLILDTETAVYEGWRKLYEQFGFELPLKTYVQCVGSTREMHYDPAAELDKLVGEPLDWETLDTKKNSEIRKSLENKKALPGVRGLLQDAQNHSVPCAVASSSPGSWVEPWLEKLELTPFFETVCCREHVSEAKPAPDLFLSACEKIKMRANQVVVLEDSYNGLLAAKAAGMRCVIVPNEITAVSDFTGAWKLLLSLEGVGLSHLL